MSEPRYGNNPLGTSSWSRLECVNCGPETVHKAGKCIHCQAVYKPSDTVRHAQLNSLNVYAYSSATHAVRPAKVMRGVAKRGRPRKVLA